MKEITGNIWDYHAQGNWIVITTNGSVNKAGECVMGRGVALQAKNKFPDLPQLLADRIKENGNHLYVFAQQRIITFPVKHLWHQMADLRLIERSARELVASYVTLIPLTLTRLNQILKGAQDQETMPVYLVRPGAGNGHRTWEEVKAVIEPILDDRFVIVQN